jgi:hypothetical protein
MADDPAPPPQRTGGQTAPPRTADLLTVGLMVFFVSLLVVVSALLTLPTILG